MAKYQVVVGNIGTVIDTDDLKEAQATYDTYVEQSKSESGRAGGEDVHLMEDGEPIKDFMGSLGSTDDMSDADEGDSMGKGGEAGVFEVYIDEGDEKGTRTLADFPTEKDARDFIFNYGLKHPDAKLGIDNQTEAYLTGKKKESFGKGGEAKKGLKEFEIYKNGTQQGYVWAKNKKEAEEKVFATYGEHRQVYEVEENDDAMAKGGKAGVAPKSIKDVGLKLDDVTDSEFGWWTQLCKKHAKIAEKTKEGYLSREGEGSGICGVVGCDQESDYYFNFDTAKYSGYTKMGKGGKAGKEEDWDKSLGKKEFKGDTIELIAYNHPSEYDYDKHHINVSGYIFKNHTKKYEFENLDVDHLIANLETVPYSESEINEIVFGLYSNEFKGGMEKGGKAGGGKTKDIKKRLEQLRKELRAERISYGELAELQSLAEYIDPSDVELLEPAGVPEFVEEGDKVEVVSGANKGIVGHITTIDEGAPFHITIKTEKGDILHGLNKNQLRIQSSDDSMGKGGKTGMPKSIKDVGLKLDDVTDSEYGWWTQLCKKHAKVAEKTKEGYLSREGEGSGICGVVGCDQESDYYFNFDTAKYSGYTKMEKGGKIGKFPYGLSNHDLASNLERHEEIPMSEIRKAHDSNLDSPYILDMGDTGYFYNDAISRDGDYNKVKVLIKKMEKGGKAGSGKVAEAMYRDADNYKTTLVLSIPSGLKVKEGDDVDVKKFGITKDEWRDYISTAMTGEGWKDDRDHYEVEIMEVREQKEDDMPINGYAKGGKVSSSSWSKFWNGFEDDGALITGGSYFKAEKKGSGGAILGILAGGGLGYIFGSASKQKGYPKRISADGSKYYQWDDHKGWVEFTGEEYHALTKGNLYKYDDKKGYYALKIFEKGGEAEGRIITFDDGFQFRVVSFDYAKDNWDKEQIYKIFEDEQSESLIDDIRRVYPNDVLAVEIGFKKEKGGDVNKSAVARERKYTSQEEHELGYKDSRKSRVRYYQTKEKGGEAGGLSEKEYDTAIEEGWVISNNESDETEIQKWDEAGIFKSDSEARKFVEGKAESGSALHEKALSVVAEYNKMGKGGSVHNQKYAQKHVRMTKRGKSIDSKVKAMKAGWRKSKETGNFYFESRKNRSDQSPSKKI